MNSYGKHAHYETKKFASISAPLAARYHDETRPPFSSTTINIRRYNGAQSGRNLDCPHRYIARHQPDPPQFRQCNIKHQFEILQNSIGPVTINIFVRDQPSSSSLQLQHSGRQHVESRQRRRSPSQQSRPDYYVPRYRYKNRSPESAQPRRASQWSSNWIPQRSSRYQCHYFKSTTPSLGREVTQTRFISTQCTGSKTTTNRGIQPKQPVQYHRRPPPAGQFTFH